MKKILIAMMTATFAMSAFAQDAEEQCKVVIESNDMMQFVEIKSFTINKEACPEFTIELKHVGTQAKQNMGHNVVLTTTENFQPVATAGLTAGLDNDYLPTDDERIIAHTDVIGGGETTEVTFDTEALEAGGDYTFFCSFPGHSSNMKGTVVVE